MVKSPVQSPFSNFKFSSIVNPHSMEHALAIDIFRTPFFGGISVIKQEQDDLCFILFRKTLFFRALVLIFSPDGFKTKKGESGFLVLVC